MDNEAASFVIEGFLVAGNARIVRLLMPPYLLDFDPDGVIGIEQRPPLPAQDDNVGIAVRLWLREGARLLGMSSASEIEARLWRSRRPFAMATRAAKAPISDDGTFGTMERKFLAGYGVES